MNKEEPKVLTRMRLSCCWGDNLNEKELNDVVDYINRLIDMKNTYESKIENLENDYYHALDKLVGGAKMTKRQQSCLYAEYLVLKEQREKRINEHISKISEGYKKGK